MTRDCRGLPSDLRVCQNCPRLAGPVATKAESDRVHWIIPDTAFIDGAWHCRSRHELRQVNASPTT